MKSISKFIRISRNRTVNLEQVTLITEHSPGDVHLYIDGGHVCIEITNGDRELVERHLEFADYVRQL